MSKVRLAQVLSGADVGLQILSDVPAFYFGTSPNKFFDYIASGIPVLTNYPGWVAELIEASDCGYVVDPGDVAKFADALEDAAKDRLALLSKGHRARELAEAKFGRRDLADSFAEWIEGAPL